MENVNRAQVVDVHELINTLHAQATSNEDELEPIEVSGNIINFNDPIGDLPLQKMIVDIQTENSIDVVNIYKAGRNMLPPPVDGTYTGNGITAVVENGMITLSGTTTSSGNALIIPLSATADVPPGSYIHLMNSMSNGSIAPSFELASDVSGTLQTPACSPANRIYKTNKSAFVQWDRIRFYLGAGVTVDGTISPMLCVDDSVSGYESYKQLNKYSIQLNTSITEGELDVINGKLTADGQTTDTEPVSINTLEGSNYIWSDAGSMTIEYLGHE